MFAIIYSNLQYFSNVPILKNVFKAKGCDFPLAYELEIIFSLTDDLRTTNNDECLSNGSEQLLSVETRNGSEQVKPIAFGRALAIFRTSKT